MRFQLLINRIITNFRIKKCVLGSLFERKRLQRFLRASKSEPTDLTSVVSGTFLKRTERRADLQQNVWAHSWHSFVLLFRSTFHASVYSYKQWRTERLKCKFLVRYKSSANFMVHGSPQMKTTCTRSQNESELSQLLSESRLSSTSYAFLQLCDETWGIFHSQTNSENLYWGFPFGKSAFHLPQFKSNLVTENGMCRLEIREITCSSATF